jgi:small GTP-binding protein
MGSSFGKLWKKLFKGKIYRLVMLGLDAAGKTSILYKLKLGSVTETVPTIGFNVEQVKYKKLEFTVFDVGGQDKIRPLWKYYYVNNNGIIFVVDSNDRDRIDSENDYTHSAKEELEKLLEHDELYGIPLLVFANKQDIQADAKKGHLGAMSVDEITKRLGLRKVRNREWYVQGSNAISGEGLMEGMEWLSKAIENTKK